MFGLVSDIHEDPDQVIAVRLALVPPQTADRLRLDDTAPNCCSNSG